MQSIKHLHWRAGFGLSPDEWQERENWDVQRAVDRLFVEAQADTSMPALEVVANAPVETETMNREDQEERRKEERQRVAQINADWLQRMGSPDSSALRERMTLFWHGHFACRIVLGKLAANYLNSIRTNALGNFRDLVLAVAQDPAMIRYLNNQQNRKQKPNENFARELLELFTIGRGNYTENDIKEAARAFTGWSSDLAGDYVFRPFQHDFGAKTFFGKTGAFNGEDIIDLILEKRETARFIAGKAYCYFVNDRPDHAIIEELADVFYRSSYDITTLMRSIFESDWFYREQNIGVKIKSPVELMAGMIRSLRVAFEQPLAPLMVEKTLGQTLFDPPNVAGWPGGKSWIDNATLMFRLNLAGYLYGASEIDMRERIDLKSADRPQNARRLAATLNLHPLGQLVRGDDPQVAFEALSGYFLQVRPGAGYPAISPFVSKKDRDSFIKTLSLRLMSLPEYQMC